MKKGLLFLLMAMCSLSLAIAQQKMVKGVVLSSDDQLPVIGAAVVVVGQEKIGASTNLDGEFSLQVPANAKQLKVSSVGYKTQNVAIKSGKLQIVLQPDNTALEELVVTAYGTVKKQSLVGSQASIDSKKLEARPLTNVSDALLGSSPGVQVVTSSGQPGSSASIRIRGFGSLNASSSPLIVVDGAVFNGSLADINTNDIKNVAVLKDAASTALYGSSAGNGVLLITTKSGSMLQETAPQISFSMSQGFTQRGMSLYETVGTDDWMRLEWRMFYNDNLYNPINKETFGNPDLAGLLANKQSYDDVSAAYFPYIIKEGQRIVLKKGTKSSYEVKDNVPETVTSYPYFIDGEGNLLGKYTHKFAGDTDWEKGLFRTGSRREYNLSSSWSNKKVRTYLSAGYLTEEGYRIATDFQRFTSRANINYDVNKYLSLGTNLSYMRFVSNSPRLASGGYLANPFLFLNFVGSFVPIHRHNAKGEYILSEGKKVYDYDPNRPFWGKYNPIFEADRDLSTDVKEAAGSRFMAKVNILPDLSLTTNFAYDTNNVKSKVRYNHINGDQMGLGLLKMTRSGQEMMTFNQLLAYKKSFGNNNFDFLLGHENYSWEYSYMSGQRARVIIPDIDEFDNYADPPKSLESDTRNYRKEGFFGRVNYDYDGIYTASLSFRRDGSSRFANNKRWGNFWSVGAGWNIIREGFMKNLSWVDNLRLRLSIGQTGNDSLLDGSGYADYYPHYTILYALGVNNESAGGVWPSRYGNPDLVWEAQTSYDLALEFGLFNRIRATVELFNKESSDLIFGYPLVKSTSIKEINKNIGKVRNYGLELDLHVDILKSKDFRWGVGMNATFFRNKIVRLPEENRKDGIITGSKKLAEGKSIYEFYLEDWKGVDPENGRSIYEIDADLYGSKGYNDPTSPEFKGIDANRPNLTYDATIAKKAYSGSSIPKVYGGFSTDVSWKSLNFSMSFAYQLGGKGFDYSYYRAMSPSNREISSRHVDLLKAWTHPGDKSNIPAFGRGKLFKYNFASSNQFLTSRSGLMLKNVSLSYDLPKKWYQVLGLKSLRIGLVGENLFLLSARKGYNPMQNFSGSGTYASYDFSRSITANLSLTL